MASFVDRCVAFEKSSDLTRVNVQYTNTVSKVLVDRREVGWVERKLPNLRSEIEQFNRVV